MRTTLPAVLLLFVLLVLPAVTGCSVAGTSAIRNGRAAYNDAIIETNNEQILAQIVRMRYMEPSGLLAVASVTANVRIQTSVGAEFGVGPESTYSGNLVPLRAGAVYEENPTISYTPVEGQQYLRQMLTPLPMDLAMPLLSALGDSPGAMTFLIKEINGIRNPMFSDPSAPDEGRRFAEIADLFASLHRRGLLLWTEMASGEAPFGLLLRREGDGASPDIARLHDLLGLDPPREIGAFEVLPVEFGVGALEGDAIELLPRSTFELVRIAADSVDVPAEHLESGLASPLPRVGLNAAQIRIRRSAGRPSDALVAFRHHGWWFWIDGTDGQSKATFRLIEAIMTSRIADTVSGSKMPVLTVPVSR